MVRAICAHVGTHQSATHRQSSPTVSVCIRAFERREWLQEAIGSVLAQSFDDFEVIVSDDSGRLGPVVQAFGDARVRYHPNPLPAGPTANIRTAFNLARGRLLALLDDDDRWLPDFLATVADRFEKDPEIGVVFTDQLLEAGARQVPRRSALSPGRHPALLNHILEHGIPASAVVMRRAVWEQGERDFPLPDFGIGDTTMWIRASLAGWAFYYVARPLAIYRLHDGQMSWSDEKIPARTIAVLERFCFDDPVSDRLRRARLAEARLAAAHAQLRRRRYRSAWENIVRAHEISPGRFGVRSLLALTGVRALMVRWVSARPRLLMTILPIWRRVRPPVGPRG